MTLRPRSSPHRLVIPFTAMLALCLTVALFQMFERLVSSQKAVYLSASLSFVITLVIGLLFKPILGE